MASGCALLANHPGVTAEQLVREADIAMYDAKVEYYQKKGNERRGKARTRMKPGVTYM